MRRRSVADPVSPLEAAALLIPVVVGLTAIVIAARFGPDWLFGFGLLLSFAAIGISMVWRLTGSSVTGKYGESSASSR